ncbi:MAG: response regulator [Pirellulaceae bacterium]
MKTLLFADDRKSIREFCKQEFEEEGYRVILARDGKEAIRLVQTEHPDLAILDLYMPQVGGLEAVERIRTTNPSIPIIFFTANDDDCLTDPRSRFATACVEKSENLEELKRTIVRLLSAPEARNAFRSGLPSSTSYVGQWSTPPNGASHANVDGTR